MFGLASPDFSPRAGPPVVQTMTSPASGSRPSISLRPPVTFRSSIGRTMKAPEQTRSFQGSIFKNVGSHSLKTGGEFRLQRANSQVPGYVAGNFSLDQKFTGKN